MKGVTRGQLFEVAFWIAFAAVAFVLTFEFNNEIEIYKFGAYGWPRVIIFVVLFAAVSQLIHDLKFHSSADHTEAEELKAAPAAAKAAEEQDVIFEDVQHDRKYYVRMALTLGLPLLYAALLQDVGFYVLTPIFIAAYLVIAGERRWKWVLSVTVFVYAALLLIFVKFLYVGLPTGNVRPFYDFSNWLLVVIR